MHPRQWPVSRKLLAISVLGLLVAVAISASAWISSAQLATAGDDIDHLVAADQALRQLDLKQSDVQISQRDALLAANEADRKQAGDDFAANADEATKALAVLDGLTLSPQLEQSTTALKDEYTSWLQGVRTSLTELSALDPGTAKASQTLKDEVAQAKVSEQKALASRDLVAAELKASRSAQTATQNRMRWMIGIALAIGFALLLGISRWITVLITRPLTALAEAADKLSNGDTDFTVDTTGVDEGGQALASMDRVRLAIDAVIRDARALVSSATAGRLTERADATTHAGGYRDVIDGLNGTLNAVAAPLEDVTVVLRALEKGDLTKRVETSYPGDFQRLRDTVNGTLDQLSSTVADVIAGAEQLTTAAAQISGASQTLSQSAAEQAASVEETSASIEEMTASISSNSDNAKVTDGIASGAATGAKDGGAAVNETVEAMKDIAGKIAIIDDIAFQTNMLALNATIEAARAGEHGKGFAVVATEVGKLAERSQVAAAEIGELASGSVARSERAGTLLDELVPSITRTSELVQEIAAASAEQSAGVGQINRAMAQMSQVTAQTASSSEELAATAEEMSAQAASLQDLMSFFDLGRRGASPGRPAQSRAVVTSGGVPAQNRAADRPVPVASGGFDESKFDAF